jgi:hypothetical protein
MADHHCSWCDDKPRATEDVAARLDAFGEDVEARADGAPPSGLGIGEVDAARLPLCSRCLNELDKLNEAASHG